MEFIEFLQSRNGFNVLMAIAETQPCTLRDLYHTLKVDSSTIGRRLTPLEEMGIIACDGNGASMTVSLTEPGETVVEHLRSISQIDPLGFNNIDDALQKRYPRILVILAVYSPCKLTKLIRLIGGFEAGAFDCLQRMEEAGIVTITPSTANSKIVSLTYRGCTIWAHLREIVAAIDPDDYESYIDSLAPIGRSYGDLIIPDIPDYCRCAYASATVLDDPLVCVSVRLDDLDGSGLRPVYEAAFLESNGLFCICHDYNPNTGLWTSCDQDVTAETVRNHMEREGTRPLNGFEFREVE